MKWCFDPAVGCVGITTLDSPLVACVSHDPNRKSFDTDSIAFTVAPGCPSAGDSVTYRIDFQNYGTAPASKIVILDTLDLRLDATTVFPEPGCVGCATGKMRSYTVEVDSATNSIMWTILMANLRGLNEPGFDTTLFTVEDTKDYIDFRVKLNDAPSECKPGILLNQAHIIFDSNEPITTPPAAIVASCDGCFTLVADTVELFEMDTLMAPGGFPLTLTPDSLPFPLDSMSVYWFPSQDTGLSFTFTPKFTTTIIVQASKKCAPGGSGIYAIDSIVIAVQPCFIQGPVDTIVQQITCSGGDDGGIFIAHIGNLDTSQFHVVWDDFSNANPREGLGAGTYIFKVISEDCCTYTDTITIKQPPPLWPDFETDLDTLFGIPGGGTPPYDYAWSTGATTDFVIRDSTTQQYTLSITDSQGCSATATFELTAIPTLGEWALIFLSLFLFVICARYIRRGALF